VGSIIVMTLFNYVMLDEKSYRYAVLDVFHAGAFARQSSILGKTAL